MSTVHCNDAEILVNVGWIPRGRKQGEASFRPRYDSRTVIKSPYMCGPHGWKFVLEKVDEMLESGVIEPDQSE